MNQPEIVDRKTWLDRRRHLLQREKAFTRERDELTRQRQQLPWVRIDKDYQFDGPDGCKSLAELFDDRRQLVVYHFMFGPDWDAGCPSCSFWADNFDGIDIHLAQRDIRFIAISKAPWASISAFRQRMDWRFTWLSSQQSDFNFDFQVSFDAADSEGKQVDYNYGKIDYFMDELPGVSVFARDESGTVFHTYSTYARGLDLLNGAYNYIDLTPLGRNEIGDDANQGWVRRHDEYDSTND